ncbi:MAG TPA: winged helix-turn-helix domain-containing protein, partial [Xanthomonadales bacterium]|nr:winged helix-turn-helix domain-containing protein [Xanthomonadales bacterium]
MPFAPEHHIVYSFSGFLLDLSRGTLIQDGRDIPLRPKSFEVLRYLVEHPGQLASKDEMLLAIWGHRHTSDGSLTQCIIDIRKALRDDEQTLVKTLPRRGYILDAPVELLDSPPELPKVDPYQLNPGSSPGSHQSRPLFTWVALLVGVLIIFTTVYFVRHEAPESSGFSPGPAGGASVTNSIAVLPFIDLSPGKDQAWFAQGLSEEILNLLAKSPDLRV